MVSFRASSMGGVIALIVTYNPDLARFRLVLGSALKQVSHVVVVDNGSSNAENIKALCSDNCDFVELGFNSGAAHALRVGVGYAVKYNPNWLLFLDDDTVLLNNALNKALSIIDGLPKSIRARVGAVLLGSEGSSCSIWETRYGAFSGTLIRPEVALKVCCRDDFFLDQADFDMYAKIRRLGYLALMINCRLKDHKTGIKRWIRLISNLLGRPIDYEPPWRYYYIVRNSTKLLMEGEIEAHTYLMQILNWGLRILLADGPKTFIKPLGLGILHALLGELGYLGREHLR